MGERTPVDRAAPVCRPFRETGYCGYGDSCVFVHDRTGASAAGGGAARAQAVRGACGACLKPAARPVEARCGHWFCRDCALARGGAARCRACGRETFGQFKPVRR